MRPPRRRRPRSRDSESIRQRERPVLHRKAEALRRATVWSPWSKIITALRIASFALANARSIRRLRSLAGSVYSEFLLSTLCARKGEQIRKGYDNAIPDDDARGGISWID